MVNVQMEEHPLVYDQGTIGFGGYTGDYKYCVFNKKDDSLLDYGITKNSLLIVDTRLPYEPDKLSVFQTDKLIEGQRQLKLSLTRLGNFPYLGRVIMSVNQYD